MSCQECDRGSIDESDGNLVVHRRVGFYYRACAWHGDSIVHKEQVRDHGHEDKIALEIDRRGRSLRLGAGKERHMDTEWLLVDEVFFDLMTKFSDGTNTK